MRKDDYDSVREFVSDITKYIEHTGAFVKEMRIEDYRLCYCYFEYESDEEHVKRRENEMGKGMVLERRINKKEYANWKDIKGKINLCKYVKQYKDKKEERKRREYQETGVYPKR